MQKIPYLPKKADEKRGFALISTLSIVVLLAFIAVGLLSLSAISIRRGANTKATEQAKVNAKLGLMEALNDLQKTMGPDQRISAPASVMVNTVAGVNTNTIFNTAGVANVTTPNAIGVWHGWQYDDPTITPEYSGKAIPENLTLDNQGFVQWLSSNTPARKSTPLTASVAPINTVSMLNSGTTTDAAAHVNAELVPATSGSYAWHVFDESLKANIKNVTPPVGNDKQNINALVNSGQPDFAQVPAYSPLSPSSATPPPFDAARLSKVVSLDDLNISPLPPAVAVFDSVATGAFSDLTTHSKSVLCDVANGGLQTDLSLLFGLGETAFNATRFGSDHIFSDSATPEVTNPNRFDFAIPLPSPDPKWSILYDYSNSYQNVTVAGGNFQIGVSDEKCFTDGSSYDVVTNPEKLLNTSFSDRQQIQPVISNAQFIYSICKERRGDTNVLYTHFVIDTVVTLWNPYNVELVLDDMEIEFYRFPTNVEFYKNDIKITSKPVHTSNMFRRDNISKDDDDVAAWGDQDDLPYRAKLDSKNVILQPGEFKVFGVNQSDGATNHHAAAHYRTGMVLREGEWNPEVGGVASRFMLVDSDYNGVGEGGSQFLEVNLGDVVTARISADKLDTGGSRSGAILETNEEEIASYIKIFKGRGKVYGNKDTFEKIKKELDEDRKHIGSIELDLSDDSLSEYLPTLQPSEMSSLTFSPPIDQIPVQGDMLETKVPLCIASLRLKSENDSANVSGSPNAPFWIHNGVTNTYFSNGITGDQNENEVAHQYELTWEPMTSWSNTPQVAIIANGQGFGATGVTAASGVNQAVVRQIPLSPPTSIAQLTHAPINNSGHFPLTSQVVGNSYAPLGMAKTVISSPNNIGSASLDMSYMANNTLFDGYFFSTAESEAGIPLTDVAYSETDEQKWDAFFRGGTLTNPKFVMQSTPPYNPATDTYDVSGVNQDTFPQYIYNEGAFNVNSTSVNAWAMFLASGSQASLPILNALTASTTLASDVSTAVNGSAFSRFSPMSGPEMTDNLAYDAPLRWGGHHRLTVAQITALATLIVDEVKTRGPFQSVSEFVNRRIEDTPLGDKGAIQTAIDNASTLVSGATTVTVDGQIIQPINTTYGLDAPINESEVGGVTSGNTSDGSPSHLTQADILNRISSSLTVRGDTFIIRAYGESAGATGRAWCEAVVQRESNYVDPTNAPDAPNAATPALTAINQTLGRRFKIVSLRWLDNSEI